jgi:hypothetical protein
VQIKVRSLAPGTPPTVECDTASVTVVASLRGTVEPEFGQDVDVELDTRGPLVWATGAQIVAVDGSSEHGQIQLRTVEALDSTLVTVRVGTALLCLEVDGEPPAGIVGSIVTVKPTAFEVWPTGT